jgi:hypothetical protein
MPLFYIEKVDSFQEPLRIGALTVLADMPVKYPTDQAKNTDRGQGKEFLGVISAQKRAGKSLFPEIVSIVIQAVFD